jgi:predicted nucleic acid-binding protein
VSPFAGSLDTNVILRLLMRDDEDHFQRAKKLLDSSDRLHVSDTAIIELVFVLSREYKVRREGVAELILGFISRDQIRCNNDLFERAFAAFVKRPSLSFEDCLLAAQAVSDKAIPLWTFDEKLARQAVGAKLVPAA